MKVVVKLIRICTQQELKNNIFCISTELEEWGPDWNPAYSNLSYVVFKNDEKKEEFAFKLH